MKIFLSAVALLMLISQLSLAQLADFNGDTVNVRFDFQPFGPSLFNSSTTVGPGAEFSVTGFQGLFDIALDIDANSIQLDVSRQFPAGNFTAIFNELEITGISSVITAVAFDAANSDAFDVGDQPVITFTQNSILLETPTNFSSSNDAADDLTRTFIWNVEFAPVPEPSGAFVAIGFLLSLFTRRSRRLCVG